MGISAYDKIGYSQLRLPSMQEMMVAPAYLTEQHQIAEQNMYDLESEANKAELLAMETPGGVAHKNYTNYIKTLQEASNSLAEQGVNKSNIKSKLGSARAAYNKTVMPILMAGDTRSRDMALLDEMRLKDSSLIVEDNPQNYSIDSYLARGNQSYIPHAVSGEKLKQSVAQKLGGLSEQILQKQLELKSAGLDYQHLGFLQKGLTPEQITSILNGESDPRLAGIDDFIRNAINSTLQEQGVDKFSPNSPQFQQALQSATSGIYATLGSQAVMPMSDNFGMNVAMENMRYKREMDLMAAREQAKGDGRQYVNTKNRAFEDTKTVKVVTDVLENIKVLESDEKSGKAEEVRLKLSSLGISTSNPDGTKKTQEQLTDEIYAIGRYTNAALRVDNITVSDKVTQETVGGKLRDRVKSITSGKLGNFLKDDAFTGTINYSPFTGKLTISRGDKESTIGVNEILSPGVVEEIHTGLVNIATILDIPPPQMGGTISELEFAKAFNKKVTTALPEYKNAITSQYNELIESQFGNNEFIERAREDGSLIKISKKDIIAERDAKLKQSRRELEELLNQNLARFAPQSYTQLIVKDLGTSFEVTQSKL